MAQGHIIPAIDTALLLASHGALCSIVATSSTAARVRPTIESARLSGLSVRLLEFPLGYVADGLPDGADNMDNIPRENILGYFPAVALLRAPVEGYLRAHAPFPTCIVSDYCHPWTSVLAANLGVTFFSMCAFYAAAMRNGNSTPGRTACVRAFTRISLART
jgi:hypothetical protein